MRTRLDNGSITEIDYPSDRELAYLRATLVGKRVRLDYTSDPYTNLRAGDLGTVEHIDDLGTVRVKWDSGSNLGLVRDAGDRFSVVG